MTREQELLRSAVNEISSLRKRNELMNARLDMFDMIMSVLHTNPATMGEGLMSPDIVFEIEKFLATPTA